ncbi:MAG: DUF885 family protein [Lamprocystis purpurea]|jgi:hypothetical protein|uniref:DUF885 family protein n=1 Tax=Lamprocystis purpurea TaxID=61598 RepID=UPI00036AC6B9|nr:DUF885 family protein [Lamprocystis purpurea]MBV5272893.1 DUF885 family protein [Lamprocystis purpurea]
MLEAAAAFDAVVAEFYEGWFRYHPDRAMELGFPVSGRVLPPQEDDDLAALCGWIEALILGLDEVAFTALDADRQLDYELLVGAARIEHLESLTRDWRWLDPLHFLPVAEIDRLTLDPTRALDGALPQLLEQIPEHLRQAQAQLRETAAALSAPLVRVAAAEAAGGCCYLRHLARTIWLRGRTRAFHELGTLAESAANALASFSHALTTELATGAQGEPGCGSAHLQLRLRYLHCIDCDPATLGDPIAGMLRATEAELERLADDRTGDRSQDAGSESGVPAAASPRLQQYRVRAEELAAELTASGLVTLPDAPLRIDLRPACTGPRRAHTDYLPAADGTGTLYLSAGGSETESDACIRDRCLANGWGGSHLLAYADAARARRLPRRLANAVSLTGGWHLYLTGRLGRSGGHAGDRRRWALIARRDSLLRAAVDLGLHTGRIGSDQALARLRSHGLTETAAEAAFARIVLAPGDALAAVLGWQLLEAARAQQEALDSAGFAERAFHDRLVSQGPIPLALALRYGLGQSLWQSALDTVFGP